MGHSFATSLSDSISAVENHVVRVLSKSCLHNLLYGTCTCKFYPQGNDEGINHEFGTSVSLFCHSNLGFCSDNDKINIQIFLRNVKHTTGHNFEQVIVKGR